MPAAVTDETPARAVLVASPSASPPVAPPVAPSGSSLVPAEARAAAAPTAITVAPLAALAEPSFDATAAPDGAEASASIVGRHETTFDPEDEARVANLRLAVDALDGTHIRPRRSLSFDHALGPRTEARGFRAAEEIVAGELRPGIGGGICQVATTLFVAAYRGGLTIADVHSHSRLPPYARPGMDAVIAEGQRDLVVVNAYPEPVVVHARLENDRVIVELETEAAPFEVTYEAEVQDEFPIRERIERTRHLAAGEREVIDHGEIGRVVYRTRTVRDADGDIVGRDRRHVRYHAMPRIIREGR